MTAAVVTRQTIVEKAKTELERVRSDRDALVRAQREALHRIAVQYQVPARLGAPVVFDGVPGQVVGSVESRVVVKLDGRQRSELFHPRWRMVWLEETGPATAVPTFPIRALPACWTWDGDEGQWSGI
jgi:hypothetical protein